MIGKSGENGDLMSILCPKTGQLRSTASWRSHLWRKVLRHVENLHEFSVVAKLECTFVAKSASALGAAARVGFPFVGVSGECFVSSDAVHHTQLHEMQSMIEGACHHREQSVGFLIQRPEAKIIMRKICPKRKHRLLEQIPRELVLCHQKIIVDAPRCPDEPVKNVC